MNKLIEYCPNCNAKREMDFSLGLVAANNRVAAEEMLLYHLHCAACNTYIRSTTMEYEDYIQPVELPLLALPVNVW